MTQRARNDVLILWDCSEEPPTGEGLVCTWTGYAQRPGALSLFSYVEQHAAALRSRYLSWIYDLGESAHEGKSLIEHFAIEEGLSYWWLTLFVAQNRYLSPGIDDAMRLLALDEIITESGCKKILLVSASRMLDDTLRELSLRTGIAYECRPVRSERSRKAATSIYRRLPQPLQAVGTLLKYLLSRWPLRRMRQPQWFSDKNSLLICSYFIYMNPTAAQSGRFESRFWPGLKELAASLGLSTNWLHLYQSGDVVPSTRIAADWASGFNAERVREGAHSFPDAYLSLAVILRVTASWLRLWLLSRRLRPVAEGSRPSGARISLWPAMRRDWYASLSGPSAISALLAVELFDRALTDMPRQERGLFIYENQSWERAFTFAWRKHGHGELVGVAHSTVRFWDLRYYSDPRFKEPRLSYPRPEPDLVALNGRAAFNALREQRQKAPFVEAEALRYGFLATLSRRVASGRSSEVLRVLILSDYVPSCTRKMLLLLEDAVPLISRPARFTVKPHPKCPIAAESYPRLKLQVTNDPSGNIYQDFDVAFASNLTSASVDARLAGVPVVIMLDEKELNFSPLRDYPGVEFASTPGDLAAALETIADSSAAAASSDFFFLDAGLPRWRRLLAPDSCVKK